VSRLYHALAEALLLALLAIVLGLLLAGWATPMAPAPLPRPAKEAPSVEALTPKDFLGKWRMTWGGGDWDVTLTRAKIPDGATVWPYIYVATRGNGSVWVGEWYVERGGELSVKEAWLDDNGQRGSEMTWTAVWQRDERGRLNPRHLSGVVKRPDGSTSTTVVLRRPAK
jgi:hypothetical protein